ncbi:Predicted glycosyl transferase [Jatrophihabitans endophyticus]|uniref:Predicted glycosyl transferase n=1 Tax=Jatrophihabitans endophyticus TaxID=1206085 RepID=A0A1M5Q6B9_9ACTN|nr:glycosyltransferase [Jatrophihabitans endophyticus]SHH09311.1 Predicted glycosyl transferase [Jatrophihabitans endophyticus]
MIGYYVHHHGSGHLTRASTVAAACAEPVVALSSLPEPAAHPFAGWVTLPADPPLPGAMDADAGGALHWAPVESPGYRARMRRLVEWAAAAGPRLVVVDVSVEVAALLRLTGVPVAVVAMPGERDDPAHTLAYRLATAVLAPWPREVYDPAYLRPFAAKTTWTGALSRFDGHPAPPAPQPGRLLVLLGTGGTEVTGADVDALAAATGWPTRAAGVAGRPRSEDVLADLHAAEVVVTHAGLNALAEVSAARRAAVVLPQSRPFAEQHATAAALDDAGLAVVLPGWPAAERWPAVLAAARERGGAGWARWNDGSGARRFAACLARTALVGAPA